jgi:hypothetical protein
MDCTELWISVEDCAVLTGNDSVAQNVLAAENVLVAENLFVLQTYQNRLPPSIRTTYSS